MRVNGATAERIREPMWTRTAPVVRCYSEPVHGYHLWHLTCWGGCLRWRTTIHVGGRVRPIIVWGGHVE